MKDQEYNLSDMELLISTFVNNTKKWKESHDDKEGNAEISKLTKEIEKLKKDVKKWENSSSKLRSENKKLKKELEEYKEYYDRFDILDFGDEIK